MIAAACYGGCRLHAGHGGPHRIDPPRAIPDPSRRCGARAAVEVAAFAVGLAAAWWWLR